MKWTPLSLQKDALDFILGKPKTALLASPGLGKTAVVLTAIKTLLARRPEKKVLIVLTKKVLDSEGWQREVLKWDHLNGIKITPIVGSPAERAAVLANLPTITCINYELLPWLLELTAAKWPWNLVVNDECFVGSTPILLASGVSKPISQIEIGDQVLTAFGPQEVSNVIRKRASDLISVNFSDGRSFVCTRSHLIWTENGWVRSSDTVGLKVVRPQDLPSLRERLCIEAESLNKPKARQVLLKKLHVSASVASRWFGIEAGSSREDAKTGNRINIQSRAQVGSRNEGSPVCDGQGQRGRVQDVSRRQRSWDDASRNDAEGCADAWLGVELPHSDDAGESTRSSNAKSPEAGLRLAGEDDLSGSGWGVAPYRGGEGSGPTKDHNPDVLRVDSITSLEPGREEDVWDLTVEHAHHFFANGVLVHNCHKLKTYNGRWFAGKPAKYERDVITGKRKKVAPAKPGLIHVAPKTERWINMSGTPSPHSIADMWSQTHLLDGGRRLGHNITAFRNNWMRQGRDGFSWEAQPGAAEEIGTAVGDICLSIKARDYLDLPELVSNVVDIVMPPKIKAQYKFLEDEFFAKLKTGEVIEAANAAVLSGKLLQHTAGFLYREDQSWEDIHDLKLDALEDLLDEVGGPAIVTYQYKADLHRILGRFRKAVVFDGSKGCIKAFAEGKIKTLLLHPGSAAEGVDGLQDGTDTIVFYSMTWNAGQHDQVIERIGPTRQLQSGHPRPVFVHYLATRGTVDMLALKRIKDKQTMQEILTEAMKERK